MYFINFCELVFPKLLLNYIFWHVTFRNGTLSILYESIVLKSFLCSVT